jgi:hypothetical protein
MRSWRAEICRVPLQLRCSSLHVARAIPLQSATKGRGEGHFTYENAASNPCNERNERPFFRGLCCRGQEISLQPVARFVAGRETHV